MKKELFQLFSFVFLMIWLTPVSSQNKYKVIYQLNQTRSSSRQNDGHISFYIDSDNGSRYTVYKSSPSQFEFNTLTREGISTSGEKIFYSSGRFQINSFEASDISDRNAHSHHCQYRRAYTINNSSVCDLISMRPRENRVETHGDVYSNPYGFEPNTSSNQVYLGNTYGINMNHCDHEEYKETSFYFKFKFKIIPIIELPDPGANKNFTENKILTISAPSGFPSSVYNWEYSTDNGVTYQPIPGVVQNQSSVNILGSNFLSIDNHGKFISFRVNTGCNTSNEVEYLYYASAPKITTSNLQETSCFKNEDGSVKLTLSRALRLGETLSLTSSNTDFNSSDYTNLTVSNFDSDNSILIENLKPGTYPIDIIGFYNGFNTYTEGEGYSVSFEVQSPDPVSFTPTSKNVTCNNGSDGEITITAQGGTNSGFMYKINTDDWASFSNGNTHIETGLTKGTYNISVKDANGCIAKEIIMVNGEQELGNDIVEPILITQPDAPLVAALTEGGIQAPSAFGFDDGVITAEITGGTKLPDGSYNFTWEHENGNTNESFNFNYDTFTDTWYIIMSHAKAGVYTLNVSDKGYANATAPDNAGCSAVIIYTLNQPPLLELTLTETNPVSCNSANTFGNPWSDGELTVAATGGVPFNPLIEGQHAYIYTWKKKNASGVYQIIPDENSSSLSNIGAGDYAVNIEDANGIILGTYSNNVLVTPTDELYTLKEPELLKITLSKVDVFCNQGNDGSIDATITGGSGNYTISWNTGATTEDLDTLVAGTYTIDVTDEKGCHAQATVTINEPLEPLEISYAFFTPTFSGATNGWIEATITGGTPSDTGVYAYTWEDSQGTNLNAQVSETINTASYIIKLNNIGAGVYNLSIKDKNYPFAIHATNCSILESSYELFEPEPLSASIALHTPISCNSTNTYGDPYSDGVLEVIAEGGVPLQPTDNNGLSYYFTWKKETSPGVWTVLTNQTTNIATNLDAGNYAANIEDANGIIIGVYENNVLVNATDVIYLFEEPPLLELSIEKQDVYCFNGSDSWAKAIITGGVPPYNITWSNGDITAQTSNLEQGIYHVSISDSRGCQVEGSIQINQPNAPLSIAFTAFATPTTGGASNGWVEAQITGGTDFDDGSYTYYWQNEAGDILNPQTTTSIIDDVYQIRLNNIPKGNYYLTIEDANFSLATTGEGCTITDNEFILYDPIEAVISIKTPISCHQDNMFNNPYSDGVLQVEVTGGLPFQSGQPYIHYWKRENSNGNFDDLNQNSAMASGLSHGNYTLNVEDSRGVVIGEYESLNLIKATDVSFNFIEPDLLEVTLTSTEISCGSGKDGTATVNIKGGIPPYDAQWSNGQSTTTATGLIANNYVVYVTDARGCQATGNIKIDQPGGLNIEIVQQTNPTCFQGNDGSIALNITGGKQPYTYTWNTGATTTSIDNLSEGTYTFQLTDANGCTAFKHIVIKDPEEIIVDLGDDKTLCAAQTLDLDGSILDTNATYLWTSNNGFTANTAQVTVSEAGTYQVTATSSFGCAATDTINIYTSESAIDAEFLISSQAYVDQDVVLINVSKPLGETVQWDIPTGVTVVNRTQTTITLRFPEPKTYQIGLISTQGACSQEIYKNIVVEQPSGLPGAGDADTPFIEDFTISPNPNNGAFEVHIELAESSLIALRIFNDLGSFIFSLPTPAIADNYTLPIIINLSSGVYLVVLETAEQTQIKRLIIK